MYNIIGTGEPKQMECSLHDSDIENMNRVFLQSIAQVAKGCNKLGISFSDLEEDILSSAARILSKNSFVSSPCLSGIELSMKILSWNVTGLMTHLSIEKLVKLFLLLGPIV